MEKLTDGMIWYVVFLFSTVFHEAAHAWSAFKMGDSTAYEGGQVSLNPMPHIRREPFGTVLVPLLTFFTSGWMMGWASAPFDFHWAQRNPRKSGWMSLAGPMANLVLVLAAALFIHLGIYAGRFYAPETIYFNSVVASNEPGIFAVAAKFLSIFFSLNVILCLFNLFPLPPLDGSGAVTLLITEEAGSRYLAAIHTSGIQVISFLVAWKLFDVIAKPVRMVVLNMLYPGAEYH